MNLCCCNGAQLTIVITVGLSLIACALLWKVFLVAPLKMVVVFLHESSHALVALCTGGRVKGMEVNDAYGGVTYTQGGNRCLTLSAGYTGSVLFGCLFLLLSSTRNARYVGACLFALCCLVTPFVLRVTQKRKLGKVFALGIGTWILGAVVLALMVWEIKKKTRIPPLRIALLVLGTFCTCHALYDVLSDTLIHKVDNEKQGKSDAVMMAEEICGTARLWGLLWSLVSLTSGALVVFALIYMADDHAACSSKHNV